MKCVYIIRRLFFFNLLSLLWWPYFCDIRQDEKGPQGIQNHKDPGDSHRISNLPTQQDKIHKVNLGAEQNLKESIVQPTVVFVNNEINIKNVKEAIVDNKIIPEEMKAFQLESSIHEAKQISSSNLGSSKHTNVNNDMQRATITRHLNKDETMQLNPNIQSNELVEEKSIKPDGASTTSQTIPIFATKVEVAETTQTSDQVKLKITSPDKPAIERREIKSDTEEVIHYQPPVDVANYPEAIGNAHQHSQYDGMPSFDEWKKMMLAEQQKGGQKAPSPIPPGKKISSQKRRRNYSSYECGAKIVAANSEAEGTSRILNELVDEYMLNPCKAKIWFVIELCETVQTSQIELANFELFSSCPKDFTVYSSDNFPTRDWVTLGTYTAAEQRVLQSFELKQEGFGKFIKIELTGHYGKEHYCPLSVVRIFGTSMVDEYEEMETLASQPDVPDDDLDRLDIPIEDQGATNLFGSATDAVMNIVKKAAQALGQHQPIEEKENKTDQLNVSDTKLCKITSEDNKCEGSDSKSESYSTISKIINFTAPLSSAQQSLFRHLHRCDQCVSPRLGYYSSAQPHCRFFQAALGPVMFKALCDWFKEHPLIISHEVPQPSSGHAVNSVVSGSTLTVTPTRSPPPQIIRIPLEDSFYATVSQSNISEAILSNADTTLTVDITNISRFRLNKTMEAHKLRSGLPIEPTRTFRISETAGKDNLSVESHFEQSSQILHSTDVTAGTSTQMPDVVKVEPIETMTEDAAQMNATQNEQADNGSLDKKPKDEEEEQFNELLSDTSTITPEDLASAEAIDMRSEVPGRSETASMSGLASTSAGQKESVFIRMGNRIKSLEINMSLSSQYLQELSQRYRRQMEEMQRTFNRTIGTLNDTAKKAAEKDLKQQEIINNLQSQVENLTKTVELLMSGRSSVFRQMIETHVCLMITEAIIMITIMSLCVRRISFSAKAPPAKDLTPTSPRVTKRRNSADSNAAPIARKVKKRSCSEEVLVAGENLINSEPMPVLAVMQKMKKKNKKRHRGLQQPPARNQGSHSSTSHDTSKEPQSDLCSSHTKPTNTLHQRSQPCENCNSGSANNCTSTVRVGDKERRLHSGPLRNLTNGTVGHVGLSSSQSTKKLQKEKESFSFRKFLKLQKRDSI